MCTYVDRMHLLTKQPLPTVAEINSSSQSFLLLTALVSYSCLAVCIDKCVGSVFECGRTEGDSEAAHEC